MSWKHLVAVPLIALALARPAGATPGVVSGTDVRVNAPGGEFAPNCTIQSEVSIAASGSNLVAGWNDLEGCGLSGDSLAGYGWSDDGGATWHDGGQISPVPGTFALGDPVIAAGPDGTFYYATLASNANGRSIIGVARSTDGGKTFGPLADASPGLMRSSFQDKEWLAVDTTKSPHRGNVYVVWTEFAATQNILFSRSTDGGETFHSPVRLSIAPEQRGTGAQVAVGPDGEVYAVWIVPTTPVAVWFTRSLDGGTTFEAPRTIGPSLPPMGHTQVCVGGGTRRVLLGDIRVLEWPSLAVDTSGSPYRGTIYVGVPAHGAGIDESDVLLLSSVDGETWTDPLRLNDDTATADNFHVQVQVGPDGTVLAAWYDRRLSLLPNRDIDVFAASSTDGGATFSANARVTDISFPPAMTNPNTGLAAGCYMGEYNGLVPGAAGVFYAAWGDNRDGTGLPDPNVYFDTITVG